MVMIKTVVGALLVSFASVASPPPVIAVNTPPVATGRTFIAWLPGEVRCDRSIVVPEFLERPLAVLGWNNTAQTGSVTYIFDIDSSGRTTSIRKLAKDVRAIGSDDIAPALAASRFAADQARRNCTIAFTPRQSSLDATSVADLTAYSVNAISGPLPKDAWDRIYSQGDCRDERSLGLQTRVFPNFKAIPATPGVREWSMVGYEIADGGKTANIETLAGTGNAALDGASREAVAKTRYYKGGRKGCRFPYWRNPATLPAPPVADEAQFRPAGATCPARHEWAVQPTLRFPEPYRRRAIEGWAIVTYDVAPWGEIANVEVVASQPTEDFGTQAAIVVRGGKAATTQGFVGCVERVKFVMGAGENDR